MITGSPCEVILPCNDPVKITEYENNPSNPVVWIGSSLYTLQELEQQFQCY